MLKARKCLWSLVVILVITLVLIACPGCTGNGNGPEPRQLEILAGTFGLTNYAAMVGVSEVLNDHTDIDASVMETTGAEANIVGSLDRDPDEVLFHVTDVDYWSALMMLPPWEEQYDHVRLIAGLHYSTHGFITIDPNITTFQDLAGKTVGIMPGPSAGTNLVYENYLKEEGVYDTVTWNNMGPGDLYSALGDGLIDAAALLGTFAADGWNPTFLLQDLIAAHSDTVHAISMDKTKLEKVLADVGLPHKVVTIPADGLVEGSEPFNGWRILVAALACVEDADETLIYDVTKALCENIDTFIDAFPSGTISEPKDFANRLPIYADAEAEVHPGAIEYYEEAGVWPPEEGV